MNRSRQSNEVRSRLSELFPKYFSSMDQPKEFVDTQMPFKEQGEIRQQNQSTRNLRNTRNATNIRNTRTYRVQRRPSAMQRSRASSISSVNSVNSRYSRDRRPSNRAYHPSPAPVPVPPSQQIRSTPMSSYNQYRPALVPEPRNTPVESSPSAYRPTHNETRMVNYEDTFRSEVSDMRNLMTAVSTEVQQLKTQVGLFHHNYVTKDELLKLTERLNALSVPVSVPVSE